MSCHSVNIHMDTKQSQRCLYCMSGVWQGSNWNPSSELSAQQLQSKEDILWLRNVLHRYNKPNMTDQSNVNVQSYLEEKAPHSCHVHQHDSWVDACPAVERVSGETVVPGDAGLLVLRGHGCQLGGIKLGQELPQAVYRLQEEDVWVNVHNGFHVL